LSNEGIDLCGVNETLGNLDTSLLLVALNMFLLPIKLRPKFSHYLILIVFLISTKKITCNFSPC